jgi:hypothetical protein
MAAPVRATGAPLTLAVDAVVVDVTSTRVELAQRQIEVTPSRAPSSRRETTDAGKPNYSGILGSLASSGFSNLYYLAEDRKGVRLTFENAAIGLGGAALGHLAQEFLFKRLTPRARKASGSQ